MKIIIADNDRTKDLGAEIRRAANTRRRGRAPQSVSPIIGALCLSKTESEEEYLREFIRLLRYRDAFDTLDFDIPRRPGPRGRVMAAIKKLLWKLLRYQYARIAFKQNLINRMFTNALECEFALRERETGELKRRIEELEAIAGSLSHPSATEKSSTIETDNPDRQ